MPKVIIILLLTKNHDDLKLLMDSNKSSCYPKEGIKEEGRIVFVDHEGIIRNAIDEAFINLENAIDPNDLDF